MTQSHPPSHPGRWAVAGIAFAALAAGALASVALVPVIAFVTLAVIVGLIVARPRNAVIALALASPLYDLVVIRVGNVVDVRVLELLWPVAVIALVWRVATGTETRFQRPPRYFSVGLITIAIWFLVAATVSGEGIRPVVEAVQTAYLATVAYLVAGVVAGTKSTEVRRWLRPWAFIAGLVLVVSLGGYLLGVSPIGQTVVTVPQMSVEYVQKAPLSQGAGSQNVGISRIGVLNQGPVGTAAMLVSVLILALACVLGGIRRADAPPAYVLLATGTAVLLLTYSRAGWLLALVAAGVVILRTSPKRALWALIALAIALAVAVSLPGVASRAEELTDPSEGSYQAHARLWVTALRMIEERPVFGWGPGMYAQKANALAINTWMATDISADQPHNWLLEIAAETGFVGGGIALVFVGAVLLIGLRRTYDAPLGVFGVWVATGCYVAMNLTLNSFRTEMMWVWFGALVGVAAWHANVAATDKDVKCAY